MGWKTGLTPPVNPGSLIRSWGNLLIQTSMLTHGFLTKKGPKQVLSFFHKKTPGFSTGGLYGVEDRVRTGDLWNHNPAL